MTFAEVISTEPWVYVVLAWTLAWKGVALWKSAKKNHIYWFVAFLILNTLGLLPIIYLLWQNSKEKMSAQKGMTSQTAVRVTPTTTKKTVKKKTVKKKTKK